MHRGKATTLSTLISTWTQASPHSSQHLHQHLSWPAHIAPNIYINTYSDHPTGSQHLSQHLSRQAHMALNIYRNSCPDNPKWLSAFVATPSLPNPPGVQHLPWQAHLAINVYTNTFTSILVLATPPGCQNLFRHLVWQSHQAANLSVNNLPTPKLSHLSCWASGISNIMYLYGPLNTAKYHEVLRMTQQQQ